MDKNTVFDFIKQSRPITPVPFKAKNWPDGLFVARLNGLDIDAWREPLSDGNQSVNRTNAMWVAVCLLNKDGNRVFDPNSDDDINALMTEIPYDVLNDGATEVMTVNGMLDVSREEAVKN